MNSSFHNLYFPIVIYIFSRFFDFFVTEKDHFYLRNCSGTVTAECAAFQMLDALVRIKDRAERKKGEKLSSYYEPAALTTFLVNL